MSVVRRRPPDFAGGMNGEVIAHSRSVKSDGYRNPSRLCSRRAIPVHPIASSIFSTKTAESQDTGIAQQLSDQALRDALKAHGIWTIEIIKRSDTAKGFVLLPRRWVVERTFAWLGRCRRLAKDWERSIASSTAWAHIASIRMLTRRTARYCYA